MSVRRHDARAMGTTLSIVGPDRRFDAAVELVMRTFAEEEARFSRFRGDSELSALNARAGSWVAVTTPFRSLLVEALDAAARTDGAFDPTVLRALEAAGYDRDFDAVRIDPGGDVSEAAAGTTSCGGWRGIEVRGREVRLPPGVGLDLGGVAKGWTVDVAVERAIADGVEWIAVSAGGDLRVGGAAPMLTVEVDDPLERGTPLLGLRLDRGALATSSTTRRAWGDRLHHVIDPRTGLPVRTPIAQATAWAPTCTVAEVLATTAMLAPAETAPSFPGLVVTADGTIRSTFACGGREAA